MKSWGQRKRASQAEVALGLMVVAAVGAFLATAGDVRMRTSVAQEPLGDTGEAAPGIADDVVVNPAIDAPDPAEAIRQRRAADDDLGRPRITRSRINAPTPTNVTTDADGKPFRRVCCMRADNTAYWTTAAWCDDLGAAVDDALCNREATSDVCCESPVAGSASETRMSFVSADDCRRQYGRERSPERCDPLIENVCCEVQGIVARTTRRECKAIGTARETAASQCEPVCCNRPASRSAQWESRGNCDGDGGEAGFVVDNESCAEVCCQLPDRSYKRDERKSCGAVGGSVRPMKECGTMVTVTMEEPDLEDDDDKTQWGKMDDASSHVDLGRRPPPASPYQ